MNSRTPIFVHCVIYNATLSNLFGVSQSKLQECQKRIDELEAELQKANNKVCHTGHLLSQMTIKVKEELINS